MCLFGGLSDWYFGEARRRETRTRTRIGRESRFGSFACDGVLQDFSVVDLF